jgi:hypothetical protein
MNVFKDKIIKCSDCGVSFVFTSGEQAYFYSKGLSEPKRCPECRKRRKETIVPEYRHDSESIDERW